MAWGGFLDRITSWLPIQTKQERLRNQIEKLEKEQDELKRKPQTSSNYERLTIIDSQLSELYKQAKNQ